MGNQLFSILIPSWNNLEFLKLCVNSIEKNSTYKHQIIIHINDGKDGSLEWVKQSGYDYTYSEKNVGVCIAMNMMRTKVKTDYICFINDDMYVLPEWDKVLYDEIKSLDGNKFFFLSSSIIQPKHTPPTGIGVLANYGDCADNFEEEKLLDNFMQLPIADWKGSTTPPNIVHRDIWDIVGGYSIEFSPGMGSDPDFTAKLLFIGVKHFKGLGNSRVYHFETKSTERVKKNNYLPQFLMKWGIPNSTMAKYIVMRGEKWESDNNYTSKIRTDVIRGWIKVIYYAITRNYGSLKKIYDTIS